MTNVIDAGSNVVSSLDTPTKCGHNTKETKETIRDGVRVVEFVSSHHGKHKTITELHMLADLIRE